MLKNLTNRTFGRLRVLGRGRTVSRPGKGTKVYWRCRCSCGVTKEIRADSLRENGGTKSCGCLQRQVTSALGFHHLPGERFSRLVVIKKVGTIKKRGGVYLCRCNCGQRVKVQGRFLRDGLIRSCGCLYNETRTTTIKHGQCRIRHKTATYNAYQRTKSKCRNPRDRMARYFYAKGVQFRFSSFAEFYAEVGDKPHDDYWLVRIDGDGHFEPGNLQWKPIKRHRHKKPRKSRRKQKS